MSALTPLLAPEALADALHDQRLRIVDLSPAENHRQGHIPGAVHLDYAEIVRRVYELYQRTLRANDGLDFADLLMLDSPIPGSGEVFDWSLAEGAPGNRPMLLAGGLDPGNVASAIERVAPYGVDVSSGVESRPGRKDPRLLRLFIEAARGAEPASGAYEGSRRPPFDWETQT